MDRQEPLPPPDEDTPPRPRGCYRCSSDLHAGYACPLIGLGPVFRATIGGMCQLGSRCVSDQCEFIAVGDLQERDRILLFGDLGYVHACCALHLLEPYAGVDFTPGSADMQERAQAAAATMPASLSETFLAVNVGEASGARYKSVKGVPGSAKSTVLARGCQLVGPRNRLAVVYNKAAQVALQEKGAVNALTLHSLGLRAARKAILNNIQVLRRRGTYTVAAVPKGLQVSLVQGNDTHSKVAFLMHHLFPPQVEDGPARLSLTCLLFTKFVDQLYAEAGVRGFGMHGGPASMGDVEALMDLARDPSLSLDAKHLELSFAQLSQDQQQRVVASHPTPASRLAFGCAMLVDVHSASLHTATHPVWTVGTREFTALTLPGSREILKLPILSYSECITLNSYLPWVKACLGAYHEVNADESQDLSFAKMAMLFRILANSDSHGPPGHITKCTLFGDDDQSINGWVGAAPNVVALFAQFIRTREASLPHALQLSALEGPDFELVHQFHMHVSLRLPTSVVAYANDAYCAAWQTYASTAEFPRDADAPWMQAARGAPAGTVEEGDHVTFVRYPIEAQLMDPASSVLIICRVGHCLIELYSLLEKRGIACYLNLSERKQSPLFGVLGAFRTAVELGHFDENETIFDLEAFLAFMPHTGLTAHGVSAPSAMCLHASAESFVAEASGADFSLMDFKRFLDERFSTDACARVHLVTSHSIKGGEASTVYILQPSLLPLERALNDGPVSQSQEPRVAYVTYTRAKQRMYLLANCDNSSSQSDGDAEIETILWEL